MTSAAFRRNYKLIRWAPMAETPQHAERSRRAFYIVPDINPYKSPITGEVITSRSKHRDHMRQHEVVEVGNERMKPRKPTPMPDVRRDIHQARQMLEQGYRPHHETYRE